MRGASLVLYAMLLVLPHVTQAAEPPTLVTLRQDIARNGAVATIARLNAGNQLGAVFDHIQRASAGWIAIPPLLAPGTDAASSEGLGIALAYALVPAAADVLRAASLDRDSPIALATVCGAPFIEPPAGFLASYQRRALASLQRVSDPALAARKAACIATLTPK